MATHHDAEIVLKLYDLRREEVMRKARNFMTTQFWPQSGEDVVNLMMDFGSEKNAYFRQVTSFWDMAATLVHRGAIDPDLFSDWSNELFFVFAKLHPYVDDVRKQTESPKWMHNVYSFLESKPEYQTKFDSFKKRVANMSKRYSAKA